MRVASLLVGLLALAGCLESSSSISFSGTGRGMNEGSLSCGDSISYRAETHIVSGTVTVTLTDAGGAARHTPTYQRDSTVDEQTLGGPKGRWHMTSTRSNDFEGSGKIEMKCA